MEKIFVSMVEMSNVRFKIIESNLSVKEVIFFHKLDINFHVGNQFNLIASLE
jgi:hypothetical protein